MDIITSINRFLSSASPAKLCIIPVFLFILSLAVLGMTILQTGLPVSPGIEFQGGLSITIATDETTESLMETFHEYDIISVAEGIHEGKYLKFGPMDEKRVLELTRIVDERYIDAKIDHIGSSFGKTLQDQAGFAILFSFIGMAIVVFVIFRSFVPSLAIVLSALADMVMTAAAMNILGIQLSLGTTAALLMLIGYSVDSDILLTSRVLKRKGTFDEKVSGAFRTGIIMTSTTFGAIAAMWIISWIGGIQIIHEIAQVLLIGLLFDVMNTWLTNVGILKWYLTGEKGKKYSFRGGL